MASGSTMIHEINGFFFFLNARDTHHRVTEVNWYRPPAMSTSTTPLTRRLANAGFLVDTVWELGFPLPKRIKRWRLSRGGAWTPWADSFWSSANPDVRRWIGGKYRRANPPWLNHNETKLCRQFCGSLTLLPTRSYKRPKSIEGPESK